MRSLFASLFGPRRADVRSTRATHLSGGYFRPRLEGLEDRTVPSSPASLAAPAFGPALAGPAQLTSPLSITGIDVTNLVVSGANQLTATLTLVGQVAGHNFTLPGVQVPITINQTGTTQDGCPILHLELQIPDLNLLGLHVQLDNCNNGPVTLDVTAVHSGEPGGGLLGDLLCGLTSNGLLDLNGTGVTGALQQALNGVLAGLLQNGTPGTGGGGGSNGNGHGHGHGGQTSDLVNLHLDGLHLNVLGLHVDTSAICLDVFAQKGGGILGDLLFNINNLLNRNNPGNAVTALTNNVLGILNGLNL